MSPVRSILPGLGAALCLFYLALLALGIGEGDTVWVSTLTFSATSTAWKSSGEPTTVSGTTNGSGVATFTVKDTVAGTHARRWFNASTGYGTLGYGLPASVGAAHANKALGRFSVSIQGDGDMMYAPGALWTAAHHKIPLLLVMHNNRCYHQEIMHVQRMAGSTKPLADRDARYQEALAAATTAALARLRDSGAAISPATAAARSAWISASE